MSDGVIRHVIFDLDGTLIDSCTTCADLLSEMLIERGCVHRIDPVGARAYMSRGGLDMVAGLLGEACTDPAADLADFRARYHLHSTPAETVFPGVAEGLMRLREAGFRLSICSNKPQILCEKVLEDTSLSGFFDVVVGGQVGLRPKPAPDLLEEVIAKLGCAVGDCLFVGDSELDHAMAAAAGMPFLFLTYGYAEQGWQAPDCLAFDVFAALVDAIVALPEPGYV